MKDLRTLIVFILKETMSAVFSHFSYTWSLKSPIQLNGLSYGYFICIVVRMEYMEDKNWMRKSFYPISTHENYLMGF